MDRLFAPWRIRYIQAPKYEGCIFCDFPRENRDEDRLIVFRGEKNFVIMNNYPYNPGHVMVAPFRHVGDLEDLSQEELSDMMVLAQTCIRVIKEVMSPDGFNIGINMGKVAGAGIEEHIHLHIVPRWNGDTNFMPVLADVRVIPEAVEETYKKLKKGFEKISDL
ncbi:HIT domain-containing protein [Geoglobus acetivorans]|uniref:HIT domain-containing protein n=1 Tax=Geoglobus acetivorans TaxID=565033 RepID=A0ABZ3H610_GEOAI|nr:HIT domain-containing protein [Geoglobus acetivorans]